MFTSLMFILSLRLAFDVRRFVKRKLEDIERDEDGNIKINDPTAKWWKRTLQKTLAIINQIIREKKKELLTKKKSPQKPTIKKQERKTPKEKETSKNSLRYISELLKKYEKFVKQDLTLMIKEINSLLHALKQKIENHTNNDAHKVNTDLQDIKKLYHDSSVMLDKAIDQFYGYQKIIIEQPRLTTQHKLLQSKLGRVTEQLEKGHKMIDLSINKDSTYLEKYLKEKKSQGILKSI